MLTFMPQTTDVLESAYWARSESMWIILIVLKLARGDSNKVVSLPNFHCFQISPPWSMLTYMSQTTDNSESSCWTLSKLVLIISIVLKLAGGDSNKVVRLSNFHYFQPSPPWSMLTFVSNCRCFGICLLSSSGIHADHTDSHKTHRGR